MAITRKQRQLSIGVGALIIVLCIIGLSVGIWAVQKQHDDKADPSDSWPSAQCTVVGLAGKETYECCDTLNGVKNCKPCKFTAYVSVQSTSFAGTRTASACGPSELDPTYGYTLEQYVLDRQKTDCWYDDSTTSTNLVRVKLDQCTEEDDAYIYGMTFLAIGIVIFICVPVAMYSCLSMPSNEVEEPGCEQDLSAVSGPPITGGVDTAVSGPVITGGVDTTVEVKGRV